MKEFIGHDDEDEYVSVIRGRLVVLMRRGE